MGAIAHREQVKLTSERREVTLSPEELRAYVGVYQLAPQVTISMTLEGDQLMTQLSGQPKFPVFAEADGKFFLKVVDAQLEFAKDDSGAVDALVLPPGPP